MRSQVDGAVGEFSVNSAKEFALSSSQALELPLQFVIQLINDLKIITWHFPEFFSARKEQR